MLQKQHHWENLEVLSEHVRVLPMFPFVRLIAPLTSFGLLFALWYLGELKPRTLAVLVGWFLIAGYCQFFAASAVVVAIGLLAQTLLAIYLLLRWRLGAY
jgi:RsiW-degrading membrane proteinase PrsW (M82 family)